MDKILQQESIFPLFNHLLGIFLSHLTIDTNQIFHPIFIKFNIFYLQGKVNNLGLCFSTRNRVTSAIRHNSYSVLETLTRVDNH